jgi:hypothetical protein
MGWFYFSKLLSVWLNAKKLFLLPQSPQRKLECEGKKYRKEKLRGHSIKKFRYKNTHFFFPRSQFEMNCVDPLRLTEFLLTLRRIVFISSIKQETQRQVTY